jgi:hypothetical protein
MDVDKFLAVILETQLVTLGGLSICIENINKQIEAEVSHTEVHKYYMHIYMYVPTHAPTTLRF